MTRQTSLAVQNEPIEDSDQTAQICRLIFIIAGRTCPKVPFLMLQPIPLSYGDIKNVKSQENVCYLKQEFLCVQSYSKDTVPHLLTYYYNQTCLKDDLYYAKSCLNSFTATGDNNKLLQTAYRSR